MSKGLSVQSVSMMFGGVQAVVNCTFDVAAGSICELIDPNGGRIL